MFEDMTELVQAQRIFDRERSARCRNSEWAVLPGLVNAASLVRSAIVMGAGVLVMRTFDGHLGHARKHSKRIASQHAMARNERAALAERRRHVAERHDGPTAECHDCEQPQGTHRSR